MSFSAPAEWVCGRQHDNPLPIHAQPLVALPA